jgi:hypothetical protein
VTSEWQRCAVVVVNAVNKTWGAFRQTNERFLWSRLRALIDDGALEGRGELSVMNESPVRLPT